MIHWAWADVSFFVVLVRGGRTEGGGRGESVLIENRGLSEEGAWGGRPIILFSQPKFPPRKEILEAAQTVKCKP